MKILTVSVAAYNVEKTIRETLDYFVRYPRRELLDVIIVDDESTDSTPQIADQYAKDYPEVFCVVHKKNGGWASTVVSGIQHAKGKYFKQLDGDDHYNPDTLDTFIDDLEKTDADLVVTKYVTYDDQDGSIITVEDRNPGLECGVVHNLENVYDFAPFMHSLCVRTELLKKENISLLEHRFYTDTEFVLKACSDARTVMFLDYTVYYYRRGVEGQSMSLQGLEKHYIDQDLVIRELCDYKNRFVKREEIRRIFDKLLYGTCGWQYQIYFYLHPTFKHRRDLISFDKFIKDALPDVYEHAVFWEVRMFRKYHYLGYFLLAPHKFRKDKRFTKDGRLRY